MGKRDGPLRHWKMKQKIMDITTLIHVNKHFLVWVPIPRQSMREVVAGKVS